MMPTIFCIVPKSKKRRKGGERLKDKNKGGSDV